MEAKILAILKELQPDYDFEEDVDLSSEVISIASM